MNIKVTWYEEDGWFGLFDIDDNYEYIEFTITSATGIQTTSDTTINEVLTFFPEQATDNQILTAKVIKEQYPYPSPFRIVNINGDDIIECVNKDVSSFNWQKYKLFVTSTNTRELHFDNGYNPEDYINLIITSKNINEIALNDNRMMSAAAIDTLIDKKIAEPHNTTITHYCQIDEG